MDNLHVYRGAIDHGSYWVLTDSIEELMRASDDRVIFVGDRDSLVAELMERYPNDKGPGFSCINPSHGSHIYYSSTPKALTSKLDELKELARVNGKVETWNYLNPGGGIMALLKEGFIFEPGGYSLTFDPKLARKEWQKIQRAQLRREAMGFVTCSDIHHCVWAIGRAMHDFGYSVSTTNMCNRGATLSTFGAVISMFNTVFKGEFGRRPIRKFGPFQALVKKWRKQKVRSGQVYREHGHGDFADWMDGQAGSRLPKSVEVPKREGAKQFAVG